MPHDEANEGAGKKGEHTGKYIKREIRKSNLYGFLFFPDNNNLYNH
jgi:hypothetical protein